MEETLAKSSLIDLHHSIPVHVNESAKGLLAEMRWPTTRDEDWKYTRTGRITSEQWTVRAIPTNANWKSLCIDGLNAWHLVFVNGQLDVEHSHLTCEEGVAITLDHTRPNEAYAHAFEALQSAYCTGSVHIAIAAKTKVSKAIHIIHYNDGSFQLSQPSIVIEVHPLAQVHIVESFGSHSTEQSFGNRKLTVSVAQNAHVHLDKIQDMNDGDFLMNNDDIHVAESARFVINTLTVNGGWTRNQLAISLDGANIEASLNGCYLPRRSQLVDNHTKVDHRFPHCNSHELYKGLLDGHSTGVFNGKVYVHLDAQKTNAYQNNANILLSDHAQMNTKPELEIYADDVKCSHGTTTGQLDEEAMFYLRSRGLSAENARKLLTTAFIHDVLAHVDSEPVRAHVVQRYEQEGLLYS